MTGPSTIASTRRELGILAGLTALAGLLRFLMAGWYLHLNQDATYLFLPQAQRIADGHWAGMDHSVPTGFLVIHGLWLALWGGDPEFTARLLTATCGTLCVPMVYFLGRAFLPASWSLLAAAAMAVNPKSIEMSGRVSSEVPYALFLAFAAWVGIWAIRRRRIIFATAAGAAIGVSYLIRPEGMVLLPVVAAGFLRLPEGKGRGSATILPAVALALGFAVTALPMIVVNYQVTGRISLSNKGGISLERRSEMPQELALTDDHRQTQIRYQLSREGFRSFSLFSHVLADPLGFTGRWFVRLSKFGVKYLPRVMSVAIVVGVLLSLTFLRHESSRPWTGRLFSYLGGTIVLYLAALSVFFQSDRFVLPMVPILAVLAAPGWRRLVAWRPHARPIGILLLVVMLGIDFAQCMHKLDKYDGWALGWRNSPTAALGRQIGERYPARKILSPGGELAYYAGAEAVIFPNDEFSAVLDYARYQEVDLICYRIALDGSPPRAHRYVHNWPENPTELELLGTVHHETPLGPVAAVVWRVR